MTKNKRYLFDCVCDNKTVSLFKTQPSKVMCKIFMFTFLVGKKKHNGTKLLRGILFAVMFHVKTVKGILSLTHATGWLINQGCYVR